MAMKASVGKRIGVTAAAWVVAFLIFFPILWTFITSFKSELDAIAMPPKFLFFNWTLENYAEVQERSNYLKFAFNSVLSIGANSSASSSPFPPPGRWRSPDGRDDKPDRDSTHRDRACARAALLWLIGTRARTRASMAHCRRLIRSPTGSCTGRRPTC